ncbi:MAG: lysozyme family protein [Acidobacteriaceae bacterium]
MDISPLIANYLDPNLEVEEGKRHAVYDDATGEHIIAGYTVIGNPTIGVGANVGFPNGLDNAEIAFVLNHRVNIALAEAQTYPWFADLTWQRQLAVTDLCFNLGAGGFAQFGQFQHLLATGMYISAANDLLHTLADHQEPARIARIAGIISTGIWQKASP